MDDRVAFAISAIVAGHAEAGVVVLGRAQRVVRALSRGVTGLVHRNPLYTAPFLVIVSAHTSKEQTDK